MLENKTIERFLSSNSDMSTDFVTASVSTADRKTKYRPDKLFPRDGYMKWDMIFNGIDCPHRMSNGAVVATIDRTWLATELNELKDFKI